jgi:hypothetical protein
MVSLVDGIGVQVGYAMSWRRGSLSPRIQLICGVLLLSVLLGVRVICDSIHVNHIGFHSL